MLRPKIITPIGLALSLSLSSVFVAERVGAQKSEASSNRGLPTRRVGGGSRDGCTELFCLPVIALMPEQLVLTSTPTPTIVFYIPRLKEDIQVEFVLRNQEDEQVCETTFTTNGKGGLVNFSFGGLSTCPELRMEQNYHWYLSVIPNPLDRAHDNVAEGWIRHITINPSIAARLQQASPLEKVQIYQENLLWHEAFATLTELKQVNPNNHAVVQEWENLVKALQVDERLEDVLNDASNHLQSGAEEGEGYFPSHS